MNSPSSSSISSTASVPSKVIPTKNSELVTINERVKLTNEQNEVLQMICNSYEMPISEYMQAGGILDTMAIDGDQAILLVNINASTGGGNLEIELPRDLIDSKTQSNMDKPYSLFEDDIDRPISFIESRTTDQARTLVITFNSEDNVIEIQGTEVLSESGGEF
jgi:hypothetical protein